MKPQLNISSFSVLISLLAIGAVVAVLLMSEQELPRSQLASILTGAGLLTANTLCLDRNQPVVVQHLGVITCLVALFLTGASIFDLAGYLF